MRPAIGAGLFCHPAYSLAKTISFFGTQPRMTQVPP
jgi:hypothetical protein